MNTKKKKTKRKTKQMPFEGFFLTRERINAMMLTVKRLIWMRKRPSGYTLPQSGVNPKSLPL